MIILFTSNTLILDVFKGGMALRTVFCRSGYSV